MIFPEEKKFLELARQGNLIPLSRQILADTETPVSAYLKLSAQPGERPSFWRVRSPPGDWGDIRLWGHVQPR